MDTDPDPDPDLDQQNLDADPDPAKSCRSHRIQIYNTDIHSTVLETCIELGIHAKGRSFKIFLS